MTPRERVIQVLLRILLHPYKFTRRDLAKHFEVSKDTIDEDIEAIMATGLQFHQDRPHYRCAVLPDTTFRELEHLQPLTKEDRFLINDALERFASSAKAHYLRNKLESLYDFQQLGLRALRRPALERIERLEAAKQQQQAVVLKNYHSNSNEIRDRRVEPFHIDADLDTLQAFDLDSGETRHFRLSRIERVETTGQPWQHARSHVLKYTDVFRIADNEQVSVQLRLDVMAHNALVEAYPMARYETSPGAAPNTFHFQARVNSQFYGLINFIMGNASHVEVLGPEGLKQRIREEAENILKKISET